MILEDGKYYPMMKVIPCLENEKEEYLPEELEYGKWLLKNASPFFTFYEEIFSGMFGTAVN